MAVEGRSRLGVAAGGSGSLRTTLLGSRRPAFVQVLVLMFAVVSSVGVSPAAHGQVPVNQAGPDSAVSTTEPPTSQDLREVGEKQRRWLSVPSSRIVVNPFDFNTTQTPAEHSNGPDLPLNAGYYVADRALEIPELLSFYRRPPGPRPGGGGTQVAWQDDFSTLSSEWESDSWVESQIVEGQLEITVQEEGAAPWGAVQRWVEADLEESPIISITVPEASTNWSLKVNDGTQAVDTTLQGETTKTGTFEYDISKATGWEGNKRFQIRMFAVGVNQPVYVDRIAIQSGITESWLNEASTFRTEWLPHELPFEAEYGESNKLQGRDHFYDEETLVRSVEAQGPASDNSRLVLAGRYDGAASWDAKQKTLLIERDDFSYAIAVSNATGDAEYFASRTDLVTGADPLDSPPANGVWALTADDFWPGTEATVAVGFATADEGTSTAAERARATLRGKNAERKRAEWKRYWDDYLSAVPHPRNFELRTVDSRGVTSAETRKEYYTSWVFQASNVLPPMPEAGFPYPQLPTGKPSMWTYGAEGSRPSAEWESMVGIQFYAHVDPTTAWQAYEGLMTRVQESGQFGGESLPTRKAQTAWVLYQLTGEDEKLARIYPALRRYLLWARENPRWICCTDSPFYDYPGEKDADFVVPLIVDMGYAQDIARALGKADDVVFWKDQQDSLMEDYKGWFWASPDAEPVEFLFPDDPNCSPRGGCRGLTARVSQGLHLEQLESPHLDGLERRFLREYDSAAVFAGLDETKYPEFSYISYGLLEKGMLDKAQVLVNSTVRDVMRVNMFSETYSLDDQPKPTGVRPSLFGALSMIDMVWLKNGYRMDNGWPHFVLMPQENGGISNLQIRGQRLDITSDPETELVGLSGSLTRNTKNCQSLDAAIGQTVRLPETCTTVRP